MLDKLPESKMDLASGLHGRGDLFVHKGHLIKETNERSAKTYKNAELISKIFRATNTPGALETKTLKRNGSNYSVTRLVDNAKTLDQVRDISHIPRHDMANILLSEHLAGVLDRHGGNYLVTPTSLHSIDHEHLEYNANKKHKKYIKPFDYGAGLWSKIPGGEDLAATPEHLARWDRLIAHPEMRNLAITKTIKQKLDSLKREADGSVNLNKLVYELPNAYS